MDYYSVKKHNRLFNGNDNTTLWHEDRKYFQSENSATNKEENQRWIFSLILLETKVLAMRVYGSVKAYYYFLFHCCKSTAWYLDFLGTKKKTIFLSSSFLLMFGCQTKEKQNKEFLQGKKILPHLSF
jgi:hypothetical protein